MNLTTTNYTNTSNNNPRKVDIYLMGLFDFTSSSTQKLSPTLSVETGGKVCAGAVKLAQKFMMTLLAYNIYYDFSWGSMFSPLFITGTQYQIRKDISTFMRVTLDKITRDIQAQETSDMPPDERLNRLYLKSWYYDRPTSTMKLSIVLNTQSNEVIPIIVPITVVP
jgi:hypothetical protein